MLLFALIAPAFPCAGLMTAIDSLAASDAQEVIFSTDGNNTTVEYNVSFYGDADSFGWIIPIFGDFVSLEDGDKLRFTTLGAATAPRVSRVNAYAGSSGVRTCGCGDSAMKGGSEPLDDAFGDDLSNDIEVTAEGFTGAYEYTVISASDPDSLAPWLAENGWETGASQPSLDAYAAEEGVQFALIKISDVEYNADIQELPPVNITYTGSNMRFPAMMARYGEAQVHTRIYVVGDQAATVSGWTSEVNNELTGTWSDEPQVLFDDSILAVSGDRAGYLYVYSDLAITEEDGSSLWVSRFETYANPGAHTLDSVFALDGGESAIRTNIDLYEEEENEESAAGTYLLLPLLLVGLGWTRRRLYA